MITCCVVSLLMNIPESIAEDAPVVGASPEIGHPGLLRRGHRWGHRWGAGGHPHLWTIDHGIWLRGHGGICSSRAQDDVWPLEAVFKCIWACHSMTVAFVAARPSRLQGLQKHNGCWSLSFR
jgi:hypothetical protein